MRRLSWSLLGLLVGCGEATLDDLPDSVFLLEPTYAEHIRPLFTNYCVACHGGVGERAGGVELDRFESAHAGAVHHACVSVREDVVDHFGELLLPYQRSGQAARPPCDGWEVGSMPTGARSHLTLEEQVILVRWVAVGAPP